MEGAHVAHLCAHTPNRVLFFFVCRILQTSSPTPRIMMNEQHQIHVYKHVSVALRPVYKLRLNLEKYMQAIIVQKQRYEGGGTQLSVFDEDDPVASQPNSWTTKADLIESQSKSGTQCIYQTLCAIKQGHNGGSLLEKKECSLLHAIVQLLSLHYQQLTTKSEHDTQYEVVTELFNALVCMRTSLPHAIREKMKTYQTLSDDEMHTLIASLASLFDIVVIVKTITYAADGEIQRDVYGLKNANAELIKKDHRKVVFLFRDTHPIDAQKYGYYYTIFDTTYGCFLFGNYSKHSAILIAELSDLNATLHNEVDPETKDNIFDSEGNNNLTLDQYENRVFYPECFPQKK